MMPAYICRYLHALQIRIAFNVRPTHDFHEMDRL